MENNDNCCLLILNYNDSDTVIKLLKTTEAYSVFKYVLIVDNASTDDSYRVLKAYENDKIKLIRSDINGGYGAGNNMGIKYAKNTLGCEYVLLSNPDVYFDESLVKDFTEVLKNEPAAALVSAVQLDINGVPIEDKAWKIPSSLEYAVMNTKLSNFNDGWHYKDKELTEPLCEVECLPGALLFFDADKFIEAGGYDENMFLFCEETVIAVRLKQKGYKTYLLADKTYKHEHSVSINKSINSEIKKLKMIFDNRRYVMKKYLNSPLYLRILAKFIQSMKILKMEITQR